MLIEGKCHPKCDEDLIHYYGRVTRELEAVRKDGSVFPCEISLTRLENPHFAQPLSAGTIRDLTYHYRSQEKMVQKVGCLVLPTLKKTGTTLKFLNKLPIVKHDVPRPQQNRDEAHVSLRHGTSVKAEIE